MEKNNSWSLNSFAGGSKKLRAHVYFDGENHWLDSKVGLKPNEWYHVVQTHDKSYLRCYVNGERAEISVVGIADEVDASIGIGARGDGKSQFCKGIIDEVRIYNQALTEQEISDLSKYYGCTTASYPGRVLVRNYISPEPTAIIGAEGAVRPELRSPENGKVTDDRTPTFEWLCWYNANYHHLLVDNDPDFSSPEDDVWLGATDDTWTKPSPGYADGTYYWMVIATNSTKIETDTWQFTIP